jgi:hypothetical protein
MPAPTTPAEALEQAALGPKRVQVGNQSVEGHDLAALIEADKYLAGKRAAAAAAAGGTSMFGVRIQPITPGGTG